MIRTPLALRKSFEKFVLEMTESLDPFVSLKLTQFVLMLVDTAYSMGYSDGQQGDRLSCAECSARDRHSQI
jgi:hypothetical protein